MVSSKQDNTNSPSIVSLLSSTVPTRNSIHVLNSQQERIENSVMLSSSFLRRTAAPGGPLRSTNKRKDLIVILEFALAIAEDKKY